MRYKLYSIIITCYIVTTFFSTVLFSQPKRAQSVLPLIEYNLLPGERGNKLYLSTRLSFDKLFFVKYGQNYDAGYSIEYTLRKNNTVLDRKVVNKSVVASDYESTILKTNSAECFTYFNIDNGIYTILPIISINNTDNRFPLDTITINTTKIIKEGIFHPVVVNEENSECNDSSSFRLTNEQNTIPFSHLAYSLLVPLINLSDKSVRITIEQSNNIIYENDSVKLFQGDLKFIECGKRIGITVEKSETSTKYFLINGFSNKLKEGPAKVVIITEAFQVDFELEVKWNNKPFTLLSDEIALEILGAVYGRETINSFFSGKKNELYNSLLEFWDTKQPNRKYMFNDLMNEFYLRADYAITNFSTINNRNGAKSDRGIIYIKLGKPDEIDRDYSGKNVYEIWTYNNLNKQYRFVDNSGLGNFRLEN